MRTIELAGAGINRSGFDRAGEIIHGQSSHSERGRVGLDANRSLNAINVHLRNAGQNVDALGDDRGCVLVQIPISQRV